MSIELYLAFVAATVILILMPGPNVALIVANSVAHGTRFGLATVAGTSLALSAQLALTVAGMTTLLTTMAIWFNWLRWIGVAYLLYLGIRAWTAPAVDLTHARPEGRSLRAIWLRGLFVSLANPKTLLFFGAFLPQFVDMKGNVAEQLLILAATFLVIAAVLDSLWALLAARFRTFLTVNGKLRNRVTGGLLIGAGAGLALARAG